MAIEREAISLSFAWKGATVKEPLSIQVVQLVFQNSGAEVSVNLPQEPPKKRLSSLRFICDFGSRRNTSERLNVEIKLVRTMEVKVGVFEPGPSRGPRMMSPSGEVFCQETVRRRDHSIPLTLPKDFEIGQKYQLVVSSNDLSPTAALVREGEPPSTTTVGALLEDMHSPVFWTRYTQQERAERLELQRAKLKLTFLLSCNLTSMVRGKKSECIERLEAQHIECRINKDVEIMKLEGEAVDEAVDNLESQALLGWAREIERLTQESGTKPSDNQCLQLACPILGTAGFGTIMRSILNATFFDSSPPEAAPLIQDVCESFSQECMLKFSGVPKGMPEATESRTEDSEAPPAAGAAGETRETAAAPATAVAPETQQNRCIVS